MQIIYQLFLWKLIDLIAVRKPKLILFIIYFWQGKSLLLKGTTKSIIIISQNNTIIAVLLHLHLQCTKLWNLYENKRGHHDRNISPIVHFHDHDTVIKIL